MGNLYSAYQNYKNDYDELEDKYNKLKVTNDSDKTKIQILNQTIEDLENDSVKMKLNLENEVEENTINKKKIETLVATQETHTVNNTNMINTLENKNFELEKELEYKEKLIEELRNINRTIESENKNKDKNIKLIENKLEMCEKHFEENKEKVNAYVKMLDELVDKSNRLEEDKKQIKKNIRDIIHYYNDNKDIIVSEILANNNTIIPDYMERNIIGHIYNILLDKIKINIDNRIENL
tara:strand:- start:1184 stop:1897 length:714 start_codon:yes stop_codon:yes gene_type:complete